MRLKIKWTNGWASVHGTGPDGTRIRRALKTKDARRAEEIRAQLEAKIWRAKLYGPESVMTFEECAEHYVNNGGELRYIIPIATQLHGMALKDITPHVVREAARRAYPNAGPATINRQAITPARAVINYGHLQGWCAPIKVPALKVPKPKRKAVDRKYLDAIRPYLPARAFALLLFLYQTGRRVSEALSLRPEDIIDGRAFIAETKNGESAQARLTPELLSLLSEIEPRHGLVFGYVDRSSLYPTMRRACKKAGVEYLGTHQLGRHSFATQLSEAGWGAKAIADAGGWKTTRMVSDIYEHPVDAQEKASLHFSQENGKLRKGAIKKARNNKVKR